ncbi:M15 family metallopeptidase [Lysinibacillus sp. 54212]|uniref:M15 family metallopeptidase n=1 Tax=Lysinibacillus sp. 54212 TaxID=3119829 RepID=UPI002FC931EA
MKKLLFIALILCGLFFINEYRNAESEEVSRIEIGLNEDEVYRGDLLLINSDTPVTKNSIPADIELLADHQSMIPDVTISDASIEMSYNVLQKMQSMLKEAKKDGVNQFKINSSYRNNAVQATLYEKMGAQFALPPGYSEHNLGLSIDIGSTGGLMEEAAEGEWLKNNAWKYGFILRYPEDKVAITGIQYEPWHFRYVGLPHSAIMGQENWTLEEYLQYLQQNNQYVTQINGQKYEITYYAMSENLQVSIIEGQPYHISGDNTSGVIVTVEL